MMWRGGLLGALTRCRSTLDAILALRLLTEIHREFQQPLHVAFVDLKAAFDSVDRNALWKAMRGVGVPPILMDLNIDLHTETSARVRLSRPPLHIIHNNLQCKAGMCLGSRTVLPINGLHYGACQS